METPVLQKQSLANFLNKSDKFLEQNLGAKKSEFVSNLLALSDSNKELSQCEPADLMKCAMNATALNLPLNKNLGYAYVIPYFELLNGFQQSLFMTIEQLQAHASKYSKTYAKTNRGLWKDEFDLMAKKTVLKLLLNRYGVLSVEMQNAIEKDQADSNGQYVDNPQGRTVIDAEVVEQNEPTEPEAVQPISQPAAAALAPQQVDFKQV